jgi:energy-coupling factor transporter ATP-binding protein EcfA2
VLELRGLTRRYGDLVALHDLSFTVREGQMFGFVGPNGAGKTTTLRIILGVLEPNAGEVRWRGRPMTDEIRKQLGYLPEDHGQTFSRRFAAHRIEPADRGDGGARRSPNLLSGRRHGPDALGRHVLGVETGPGQQQEHRHVGGLGADAQQQLVAGDRLA